MRTGPKTPSLPAGVAVASVTMGPRAAPNPAPPSSAQDVPFLQLLRVRHFRHFLVLPLATADLARPTLRGALALGRGVGAAFCALAFAYLANTVADRGMDRDLDKNPLARASAVADRRFDLPLAILGAGALALAATGPLLGVAAATLSLAAGWAYSLGPRLKARPVIGTLMNALIFAPLLLLGLDRPAPPPRFMPVAAAFVALLLQNQLLHEAADAVEDREGGVRTTFLTLGGAGAALLAALCGAAAAWITAGAIAERHLSSWLLALVAPHLLVFPAALALAGHSPARMAQARVAQRWAAVASGALLVALELG
jgi:4-hydroxybenzoate polyprenyltransferase